MGEPACVIWLAAEAELRRREQQRPSALEPEQLKALQAARRGIRQVWNATSTTDRDRKDFSARCWKKRCST